MLNTSDIDILKQKTEQFLLQDEIRLVSMPAAEIRTLVSELNKGILELEKQNRDLKQRSQNKDREETAIKSPARFTLNGYGYLVEVDQACADIFGISRTPLQGSRIFKFIKRDSKKVFFRHCMETLELGELQSCHIKLMDKNGDEIQISLESRAVADNKGNKMIECRFVT
jgi:PAS domain S-box-containing protein